MPCIVRGQRPLTKFNTPIWTYPISIPIPPRPKGEQTVELSIEMDHDYFITVKVYNSTSASDKEERYMFFHDNALIVASEAHTKIKNLRMLYHHQSLLLSLTLHLKFIRGKE